MATDGNQPPQAWTCARCGAALPVEAGTGALVICGYCGTPFVLPTARTRCGGVSISGGSVTIGGDVIGGTKHVVVTSAVPSAATVWDEPDTSAGEGVSIKGRDIQVHGDVIGSSVRQIVRPAPTVQTELVLEERPVDPPSATQSVPVAKHGWREKIKGLILKVVSSGGLDHDR